MEEEWTRLEERREELDRREDRCRCMELERSDIAQRQEETKKERDELEAMRRELEDQRVCIEIR